MPNMCVFSLRVAPEGFRGGQGASGSARHREDAERDRESEETDGGEMQGRVHGRDEKTGTETQGKHINHQKEAVGKSKNKHSIVLLQ